MSTPPSPRSGFEKLQRIARVLLIVYVPGILFAGAVTLASFAYGLAHASEGAANQLLVELGLVMLVALGLPLLLLPGLGPAMKAVKSLGMLVLALGLLAVAKAVWYASLEPSLMTQRFNSAMENLSIVGTSERPLLIDGKVVGLRLAIDVRLAKLLAIDPYGSHALDFMQSPTVLAQLHDGSSEAPLRAHGFARVTLNGQPPKGAVLPAGVYRAEQDFVLPGLQLDDKGAACRQDAKLADADLQRLASADGLAMHVVLGARLALRDRLGYRDFRRETPPLKFRYDAPRWKQDLEQLPVESCSVLEQRRLAAEQAATRARLDERYAAGDSTLSASDNPLYQDMCAEDLAPLRQRLAAGRPRYAIAAKLIECGIVKPRPELFALVMPVLHAAGDNDTDYCDVLRYVNSRRAIPFLEQLEALKLPMSCPGERRHEWLEGVQPVDANGNMNLAPPHDETLRWLQVLVHGGVPVCVRQAEEGTLLSRYVNTGPAPLLELLLKAGCDPSARPRRGSVLGSLLPGAYSPQLWWAVRRFSRENYENRVVPVGAMHFPAINRLMGEPSAAELNEPDPESGKVFLHHYPGIAINEPDLLLYLVGRGARLDAAEHKSGRSWYSPGYERGDNNTLREKPLLDRLDGEQLRQLITPHDSIDGKPGMPMGEVENFSAAGFGRYLCERGVVGCPGG